MKSIPRPRLLFLILTALFHLYPAGPLSAKNWNPVNELIGVRDAVLVADPEGNPLFSRHAERKLIPASTLKLLTSLVARHHLGSNHRFVTEFYVDSENNLKIKGYGDPFLISEVIADIAEALGPKIEQCQDLVLDDTYFEDVNIPGVTASFNPYDSPNGAVCANFNTVHFNCTGGQCASAEPQTPFVSFVLDRVCESGLPKGRIVLSADGDEASLYAGYIFKYFLQREGVSCTGKVRTGKVGENDRLIHRYTSIFSLDQIISKLLEFSNNFVANQLFIAAGAAAYGPPGNLEKGVRAAKAYLRENLKDETIDLEEGSGISRNNRLSARSMLKILEKFKPHHRLMTYRNGQYYKTGSLFDVKTRAGFMEGASGKLYPFVVLVNTPGKSPDPILSRIRRVLLH